MELEPIVAATRREKDPLRGAADIGVRVGKVINRSKAAVAEARRKRTDDLPVHSFRTLLTDLGTLAANTMQVADNEATFTLQTQPALLRQRCFELLGVTPRT